MIPFDFSFAAQILPALLRGMVVSVQLSIASGVVAVVFGLVLALMRRSRVKLLSWPALAIIEFIRATPLLVQVYFLFFVLPAWGIVLPPVVSGVLGLGLHYASYMAEVYRAGIDSVPRSQWEAGTALNFTRFELYRWIILPQAVLPIIPALGNYLIAILKDTPILAAITVVEVTQVAREISANTFLYIEPMTMIGVFMLVLSLVGAWAVRKLDLKLGNAGAPR